MKKIVKVASIVLVLALISGCGTTDDLVDGLSGGSGNANGSDFVSYSETSSGFKIKLEGIDNKYVHVKYILNNSRGGEKLSYGMNYNGTVVTDCIKTGAIGDGLEYSCTTTYDTNSPVGDPSVQKNDIILSTNGNRLIMQEVGGFGKDNKDTIIKTF